MPEFESLEWIRRLATRTISQYGARNARMSEDEAMYFNEHTLPAMPKKGVEVKPPTAHGIVEDFITAMTYKMPTLRHVAAASSRSAGMASERLTAFLNVFFERWEVRKVYTHLLYFLMTRGAACLRTIDDEPGYTPLPARPGLTPVPPLSVHPDELERYAMDVNDYTTKRERYNAARERRQAEMNERLPILVDVIDPMFVYPDPSDSMNYVFLRWERTAEEVRKRWQVDIGPIPPDQKVYWMEYWDDEKYAYWVESFRGESAERGGLGPSLFGGNGRGEHLYSGAWVVPPTKHDFGFLPFVYDGPYTRPVADVNKRHFGVFTIMKKMIEQEAMLMSQEATLIKNLAWAAMTMKTGRAMRNPRITMEPLEITYLLPEEELNWFVPQLPIAAIESQRMAIDDKLARKSVPATAMGRQATRSAAQQAMIAAHGRLALLPAEQCVQRLLSKTGGHILRLIERVVGEPLTVVGEYEGEDVLAEARPADINGNYNVQVTLTTPFQEEIMGKLPLVSQLLAMNLISRQEAAEMLEIPRPQRQYLQRLVERIMEHPAVQEALTLEAVQGWWPEMAPTVQQIMERMRVVQERQEMAAVQGGQPTPTQGPVKPGPPAQERGPRQPRAPRQTPAGPLSQRGY